MGWVFELEQGGKIVASGAGPKEAMLREAAHYAMVYGQDGPVKAIVRPERPGEFDEVVPAEAES